ncbi:hypothetical protein A2803_03035 [Candidatus Woesebacteria bacterium RIFCSPHIGHO2_01_FULL_44_21]|uniref:Type II secretion system protein GspG C-terminal domain-containing protein n=1 Tax=Candidatus Woesebacteria bacterium RIFCSPHIGHO2_01_FULL_44_21 TaxID=1802503 RepID=A0A1F7Z0K9_9BACT|nr:MAG: hypothetical protein A2803_03035 [Candidatus Woesebacteria bacterium RIFCSPHIGHO2_01_FULL_44_21]OGM69210.1 MAG: hypothetical protein A2897_04345 [Candidatus Woesebacteria bacterium RIFCSPLOWO2_01_FULL_44_24b]
MTRIKNFKGFTLIELLITIMIIGILVTIATFGLRQAQSSARDGKRKADLEEIAIGLELYRSECNRYPAALGASLVGSAPPATCTGTYITDVPTDPSPPRAYAYSTNGPGTSIILCAALEQAPNPAVSTTGCGSCGGSACNWRIARP